MAEPSDLVYITWPPPHHCGGRNREPNELDPIIQTMDNVNMQAGENRTFRLAYQTFKGSAMITLKTNNRQYRRRGLSRNACFTFAIEKATSAHNGYYTVEVLDEGRREQHSQNPVKTSFRINVY